MKRWFLLVLVIVTLITTTTAMAEANDVTYEYAFVRGNNEYQMYYVFDMDDMIVRYFQTESYGVMVGTFSGDVNTGFSIHWMEGWDETFKILDETNAVLIDNDGLNWDYQATNVADAVAILQQDGYEDMELE